MNTRFAVFLMTLVWVMGLSTLPCVAQTPTPTQNLPEIKLEVAWTKQVSPNLCGLAAIEMIEGFYGQKLNDTQKDWLRTAAASGSGLKGSDLVTVLRAEDDEAVVFPGTFSAEGPTGLYYQLNIGRPLVVMITSKDGHNSHYDVVVGYDLKQGQLLVIDPAIGPLSVPIKDFAAAWNRARNFTLLAVPESLVHLQETPGSGNSASQPKK